MFERGNAKDLRRVQPDLACRADDLYGSSAQMANSPLIPLREQDDHTSDVQCHV